MNKKNELYMTAYKFKAEEDARHEADKQAVVRLLVQHKQQDLLPILGLEEPKEE